VLIFRIELPEYIGMSRWVDELFATKVTYMGEANKLKFSPARNS
jgi:hypothetical protein